MLRNPRHALLSLLLLVGCASNLERGEDLYRQGDLRGALSVWEQVEPRHEDFDLASRRQELVGAELDTLLRRYEKRALFFESEGRLGEAVLYFRLALKMDPDRPQTLARVQRLARELKVREQDERTALAQALEQGTLRRANVHASNLERLNPFDPSVQIDIRQVQLAAGGEIVHDLEAGKRAYATGHREIARAAFKRVLELDDDNEAAHGYLSFLNRFDEAEAERALPAAPASIPQEEILAEGHYQRGRDAENEGDPFSALTEYRAAVKLNPQHAEAKAGIARLRKELRPMVDELYAVGARYFQDEDLHNALRTWRRVLLIDPRHQRSRENMERAERILSRLEEIETGGS